MTHPLIRHPQSEGRSQMESVALTVGIIILFWMPGPDSVVGQTTEADAPSLIERYQAARHRLIVRRHLERDGQIRVLPPKRLPTPTDSLSPSDPDQQMAKGQAAPIRNVWAVGKSERETFRERFADPRWAFLGSTPYHTFLDTTRTQDLRARLQAQFGAPTRTLGDASLDGSWAERAQFEYWFVVNDSIPIQVTDARGPRGRGLILMAERRYRDQLRSLRDALLAPLQDAERAPYVDYYYDNLRERWYRTGFDGRAFFRERVKRTAVVSGRRARLDTVKTSPSSSSPADGSSP